MAFFDQVEAWITLEIECVYAVLNNLSTHRAVLTLDGEYLDPSAGCGASTASPETEGAQVIQVLEVVTCDRALPTPMVLNIAASFMEFAKSTNATLPAEF